MLHKLIYLVNDDSNAPTETGFDACGWILIILSYILVAFTFPVTLCFCINVCQNHLFI
jgi:hypothetical protein